MVHDRLTENGYIFVSSLAYPNLIFSGFEEVQRDERSVTYRRVYEEIQPYKGVSSDLPEVLPEEEK